MLKDRSNDNIKGNQTSVISYPYPYCDVSLPDLRTKSDLDYQDMIANEINLTTLDDLDEQHEKFQTQNEFKDAKFAQNCVNPYRSGPYSHLNRSGGGLLSPPLLSRKLL